MTLKDRVLKFRVDKKHISQEEFAKMCGVNRMTVYRIENGENASRITIAKIESVIGKEE